MDNELSSIANYIRESRALNIDDQSIAHTLYLSGWPIGTLQQAFSQFEKRKIILAIRGLFKEYTETQDVVIAAINGIKELNIFEGEFLAISGQSGSGKSTLLNIIGCIDSPTRGEIYFNGIEISQMSEREKVKFRLNTLSYVFQFFNLLENFTAVENIMFQMKLRGVGHFKARRKAMEVLDFLGLADRANNYPSQLSGGQQQRLAIGRAIAKDSPILLADEPTAHLDTQHAENVMHLLREVNGRYNKTVILVTHEPAYAKMADRIVYLSDGRVKQIEEMKKSQNINWTLIQQQGQSPQLPVPPPAA